jgi:signal transduction histidine kinase
MADEVKAKLFTSFFSTKGHQGTGLGLMVTRKLVEEHGGTVEVRSTLGQGTTFTMRLPFRSECPAAPAPVSEGG